MEEDEDEDEEEVCIPGACTSSFLNASLLYFII